MLEGNLSRGGRLVLRAGLGLCLVLIVVIALGGIGGGGSTKNANSAYRTPARTPPRVPITSISAPAEPAEAASTKTTTTTSPAANPAPKALTSDRAIGQMLMSHVTGLTASADLLTRVRRGEVGSVILYSENIATDSQVRALTSSLQRAAREGGNPPLLIGTDQEGGSVKRIKHGAPTISPEAMGASSDPFNVAERQGRETATHLRSLGINLDFAPVSDVPTTADNFLHDRAFSHERSRVVAGASGFAVGLAQGHVAGSAKHFPGLGGAGTKDSDFTLVSIPLSKSQLRASYAPYEEMARLSNGDPTVAAMVMISDAAYPALDSSGQPAVLSPKIVQGELGRTGLGDRVTITDDLEVPSTLQSPNVPVRAVEAGDDILMFAQHESASIAAFRAIHAAVKSHAIPRASVLAAASKVIAMKARLGLG